MTNSERFAMTSDIAEEAELAWDEFLPDTDEAVEAVMRDDAGALYDEDEYEDEEETLELAAQDLELRWDAFEGDQPGDEVLDEVAAADAARISAALERMERRVMGMDDEDDEFDAAGSRMLGGAAEDVSTSPAGRLVGSPPAPPSRSAPTRPSPSESAESAESAELILAEEPSREQGSPSGLPPITPEDRMRIDDAFARMEEALFGTGSEDQEREGVLYDQYAYGGEFDEDGEPDAWIEGHDTPVVIAEAETAEHAPVGSDADDAEPEAWLEDEAFAAVALDGTTAGVDHTDVDDVDGMEDEDETDEREPVHTEFAGAAYWLDGYSAAGETGLTDADRPTRPT